MIAVLNHYGSKCQHMDVVFDVYKESRLNLKQKARPLCRWILSPLAVTMNQMPSVRAYQGCYYEGEQVSHHRSQRHEYVCHSSVCNVIFTAAWPPNTVDHLWPRSQCSLDSSA